MKKIDSVTDIKTDIPGRVCSFKVAKGVDYETKLAEFAKGNEHLQDYSIQ